MKRGDAEILVSIRALTDDRPTYGYHRIWALLNRHRGAAGLSRLNHKRIYRLMSQNGLLLQRYTGKPPGRAHEGQCVRVAFALDTCDREVTSWVATTRGISGEMIRDLMLESLERRFDGTERVPHPIEWLSDNGSCYRAQETVTFAQSLGLVPCFTPVRLPQSNGMAEAFVKTFKRGYVYVHDRPDAQSAWLG